MQHKSTALRTGEGGSLFIFVQLTNSTSFVTSKLEWLNYLSRSILMFYSAYFALLSLQRICIKIMHKITSGDTKYLYDMTGLLFITDDQNAKCGFLGRYPAFLEVFATAKWFLAFMSIYVLFQSLLVSGYLSSVITTIEKR